MDYRAKCSPGPLTVVALKKCGEIACSSPNSLLLQHVVISFLSFPGMEAVRPPLMEAAGSKTTNAIGPPRSDCTCCWPREAFKSAATLLGEIENLCSSSSQERDSVATATSGNQGSSTTVDLQHHHLQDARVTLPACAGLIQEALDLLVDVLRCVRWS